MWDIIEVVKTGGRILFRRLLQKSRSEARQWWLMPVIRRQTSVGLWFKASPGK
jgi:hypothetical protein